MSPYHKILVFVTAYVILSLIVQNGMGITFPTRLANVTYDTVVLAAGIGMGLAYSEIKPKK